MQIIEKLPFTIEGEEAEAFLNELEEETERTGVFPLQNVELTIIYRPATDDIKIVMSNDALRQNALAFFDGYFPAKDIWGVGKKHRKEIIDGHRRFLNEVFRTATAAAGNRSVIVPLYQESDGRCLCICLQTNEAFKLSDYKTYWESHSIIRIKDNAVMDNNDYYIHLLDIDAVSRFELNVVPDHFKMRMPYDRWHETPPYDMKESVLDRLGKDEARAYRIAVALINLSHKKHLKNANGYIALEACVRKLEYCIDEDMPEIIVSGHADIMLKKVWNLV